MLTYLTEYDNIFKVKDEFSISEEDLPSLSLDERNTLAEFVTVLAEVRRVARQFEADRELTMSRAPRLLRELSETISIIAGEMTQNFESHYSPVDQLDHLLCSDDATDSNLSVPKIPSTALQGQR